MLLESNAMFKKINKYYQRADRPFAIEYIVPGCEESIRTLNKYLK